MTRRRSGSRGSRRSSCSRATTREGAEGHRRGEPDDVGLADPGVHLAAAIEKTRFATATDGSTRYALSGIAIGLPGPGEDWRSSSPPTGGGWRSTAPRSSLRVDPAPGLAPSSEQAASPTEYLPILGNKALPLALKLAREAGPDAVGLAVIPARVRGPEEGDLRAGARSRS